MKVLEPQLSADKRQQVQERMLGPDVLDVARFPLTFAALGHNLIEKLQNH